MDEKEHNQRSARDALMIELIGDLGRVNDQITALPSDIKYAIEGSLRLIADAVEQTKKASRRYLKNIGQKSMHLQKRMRKISKN